MEKLIENKSMMPLVIGTVIMYLKKIYTEKEIVKILKEIFQINKNEMYEKFIEVETYDELDDVLSKINEYSLDRKKRGVYYTPKDLVKYVINNTIKIKELKQNYEKICFKYNVFDPTCGTGEFLLGMLNFKINLLTKNKKNITKKEIERIISTLYGNDINIESIKITKIRILLNILDKFGVETIIGISSFLIKNFYNYDFVTEKKDIPSFDIIIGNPPYVEVKKTELGDNYKYGNIYANVLENSSLLIKKYGVMSFIVPLSYVATPRMHKIREKMKEKFGEHHITNFSDRPDCLFVDVHQKLSIVFFKNTEKKVLYTSNYNYWYKNERKYLFNKISTIENKYEHEKFIPKLGNKIEIQIYDKIIKLKKSFFEKINKLEGQELYINLRATYWIKVFDTKQKSSEYKEFKVNKNEKYYIYCLLNSSLFWWYWICVSDCWHITQKELKSFMVPDIIDEKKWQQLARELKVKLEKTKVFVGTKQTDYEYKHKECLDIIHKIDDKICKMYGLSMEEKEYIKTYALKYRTGRIE